MPSARIQCIVDRHRHHHLLPRKSIDSGEIEVKQVKDQLAILPEHAKSATVHTIVDGYDSTFTYPEREYAGAAKRKSVQLRLEPPTRFPGAPALPRVPWNRPIHVAAGQPMGRRARGILLQDAQARTGKRQELQDEGGGEAGRVQMHRLCCNRREMHLSIGYNAPCDLERDVA